MQKQQKKIVKLELSRQTLRQLTNREHEEVRGGAYGTFPTASEQAGGCTVRWTSTQ
jgi:transketolase